jgi:hypothetical protein
MNMKRQLIALIVMLAIGLQGSMQALAASALMTAACQTAALQSHSSQDSCCAKGHQSMSCCLEACVGTVTGIVPTGPQGLNWIGFTTLVPQIGSTRFSSRGYSPLIRPPIL